MTDIPLLMAFGGLTVVGIVFLAVPSMTTDAERASHSWERRLNRIAKAKGIGGRFRVSYPEGFSGMVGCSYAPDTDRPPLPQDEVNKFFADNPVPIYPRFFWTNRNLTIIGASISVLGVLLGVISQIVS